MVINTACIRSIIGHDNRSSVSMVRYNCRETENRISRFKIARRHYSIAMCN